MFCFILHQYFKTYEKFGKSFKDKKRNDLFVKTATNIYFLVYFTNVAENYQPQRI